MKTAISAPAPDEGAGNSNGIGNGNSNGGGTPAAHPPAPQAQAADGPRYGQGGQYNHGLRYVLGAEGTPSSDGAKVKMDIGTRTNDNLLAYIANHIAAMTDNANFETPLPPAPEFLTLYQDYQAAQAAVMAAKTTYDDAISERDAKRGLMTEGMNARGAYVQTASNGNRNVIISSGLNVRSTPTPVGILPPPVNLLIELNGTPGLMLLSWGRVPYARSYVIQCSPADTMERVWSPFKTSSSARLRADGLTLGKVYAFRIAAIGGSTGQSDWSAEVVRMAA